MVFAEDFSMIESGRVLCYSAAGVREDPGAAPNSESIYGRDLRYALYVEEEAQMFHHLQELQSGAGVR